MSRIRSSVPYTLKSRPFTVYDAANRLRLEEPAARRLVAGWLEEGLIEETGEVAQWLGADGRPAPGRPRIVYRAVR